MAGPTVAVMEAWDKVTGFLHSQVNDEENWAFNTVSVPLEIPPCPLVVIADLSWIDFMVVLRN